MRDRDVFAAFCQREHPQLVRAMTLYVGARTEAEDLVQEALARTWRDWHRLQDTGAAPAYAYRAAVNLAKNRFRARDVRRRLAHLVGTDDRHHDSDGADTVAVRQALGALPHRHRATVVLRFYGDLSVEETARVLDVPPGTVKTWTRRALTTLRASLSAVELEEVADAR